MILDPFDLTQLSFAVVVSIVFILFIRSKSDRRKALFKKIPGPYRYPFFGTSVELNLPNEAYYPLIFKLKETFGDRYILYACGFCYVVLSNPDDIEKLLTSSIHITKGQTYNMISPWLGEGLLTSTGAKWQARRKLLTPSFHFRILEDFLITFNEQAEILIDILRTDLRDKQEKDICKYITRCTLDIIGETAMGKKLNSQREIDSAYVKAVNKACEIQFHRTVKPLIWPDFIFYLTPYGRKYKAALKALHDFTDNVIREKKASRNMVADQEKPLSDSDEIYWHGKRRLAFLDLLLDAQDNSDDVKMSDLDIREEVDTFMFEGHDTTSASLNWTIFLLACNPECQAKVHQELDGIFGGDKTRSVTSKDLAEMKYLEMCIKEALRIFPSVPFISRSITSDFILDDDVTIPAGCDIILLTMPIHRNESIYPDPLAFQPDRFLPENTVSRHPFSYIPFSAGPRNCIGKKFALMEEKVILGNIFRNFIIEPAESLEDVVVMMEVVTRPRDGLKICLVPR